MHGMTSEESTPYHLEIEVMKEMGWSFRDLYDTPSDMVETVIERISAHNYWTKKKSELDRSLNGSHR